MKKRTSKTVETVTVDGMELRVVRSGRRSFCMRIASDGMPEVLVPYRADKYAICSAVRPHIVKIAEFRDKKKEQLEKKSRFVLRFGDEIRFLGGTRRIEASESGKLYFDSEAFFIPGGLADDEIKEAVVSLYKKAAKSHITERVMYYAPVIGCDVKGIRINSARSRYASCSAKNSLNFSWYIMMASPSDVDYVVIHELCHMHHFDHSAAFWKLVERYCPDYKIHKNNFKILSEQLGCEDW